MTIKPITTPTLHLVLYAATTCKIERRKSGVCGAGVDLDIFGRHA